MNGLEGLGSVWELPPGPISNAMKAALFVERAKVILNALRAADPAKHRRLTRKELARRIGCGVSALTQNRELQPLVGEIDRLFSDERCQALTNRVEHALKRMQLPDLPLRNPRLDSPQSWLLQTDESCVIDGVSYPNIPAIAFFDGIDESSANWLRHLLIEKTLLPGTVDTYADTLRPFLAFCRLRGRPWHLVDDRFLTSWKNYLLKRKGLSPGRINDSLTVIFSYCEWCETERVLEFHVGCHERDSLPPNMRSVKFAISAKRTKYGGWKTPLLIRTANSSVGNRETPTDEQIETLHRNALRAKHGVRNSTLGSWALDTGGRRAELLQVKVPQLPDNDQLEDLIERSEDWSVTVVRKGGRRSTLKFSADCLLKTKRYLKVRKALVANLKLKKPGYTEPPEVFLSESGSALKPGSVTNLFKQLFRSVGMHRANIHRLRAKYGIECCETILDAFLEEGIEFEAGSSWVDTILTRVAFKMGHSNPASLKHYLDYVLERRMRTSEAAARRTSLHADREARLIAEELLRRHRWMAQLQLELMSSDSPEAMAKQLRAMADQIEAGVAVAL